MSNTTFLTMWICSQRISHRKYHCTTNLTSICRRRSACRRNADGEIEPSERVVPRAPCPAMDRARCSRRDLLVAPELLDLDQAVVGWLQPATFPPLAAMAPKICREIRRIDSNAAMTISMPC